MASQKQLQARVEIPQPSRSKVYFEDVSHIDIKPEEAVIEEREVEVSGGCCARNKVKIGLIIGFLVLAAVATGIVVWLTWKKETKQQTCPNYPTECQGVPGRARKYIFDNYVDPDQVRSLLQLSRNFAALKQMSTTNQKITQYRDILRSVECLSYNLEYSYSSAYEGLLNAQLSAYPDIMNYLDMNEAFSGNPIILTPQNQLVNTCQFTIVSPPVRSRRLLVSAPCPPETSVLIFIGGFGQSPSSIIQNLMELRNTLGNSQNSTFNTYIALGPLKLNQLSQYFNNLIGLFQSVYSTILRVGYMLDIYPLKKCVQLILDHNNINTRRPEGVSARDYADFRNYFRTYAQQQFKINSNSYDWVSTIQLFKNYISDGKKIVYVAHGEGSFHANYIYNYVISMGLQTSVSKVFIAPLANETRDGFNSYITYSSDQAINDVRVFEYNLGISELPLPANVNHTAIDTNADSGQSHGMRGYLTAYRQQIISMIIQARDRAQQPTAQTSSGLITVSLTWFNMQDLDLHIIEPRAHVYKLQPNGTSGYLDRQATMSGPEHYFTGCTIDTGIYEVKANFFSGSNTNPMTPTFIVRAGSEIYVNTMVMQTVYGASGNQNPPYTFCTINVTRKGDSYQFKITPA